MSCTGLISDIQRFSLHDGPGIRTTVFLKGCPLRCFWCHNPETWSAKPKLRYCKDACCGCGNCLEACPKEAHIVTGGCHTLRRELCTACGDCVDFCSYGALEIIGTYMTCDALFREITKDKHYYASSGGGVTLSGGEPLSQHLFCLEFFRLCKSEGIHCAIETSGFAPWNVIESLLPYLNLVILDIKLMDEPKHLRHTGVSNKLILENAKRLSQTGTKLIVRTPVVPGVNNDAESIKGVYLFIRDFPNLIKYELMPYHKLAESKYESLGAENPAKGLSAVTREEISWLYSRIDMKQ